MMELMRRLIQNEEGQGLAEYALILVLIAVAVIGVLTALGTGIGNVFDRITDKLGEGLKEE